jgi:hypothetical protein
MRSFVCKPHLSPTTTLGITTADGALGVPTTYGLTLYVHGVQSVDSQCRRRWYTMPCPTMVTVQPSGVVYW